jgi:hypothetical protein
MPRTGRLSPPGALLQGFVNPQGRSGKNDTYQRSRMTSVCFSVAENRLQADGCASKNLRAMIIMMLAGHNRLLETLWEQSLAVIVW